MIKTIKTRSYWLLVFLLFLSLCLQPSAWAGEGDGSGGGKNNPLLLITSTPAHGQKDIQDLSEIKLTFNKNIAYMTVREENCNSLSLWAGENQVPIEVVMADDQIEPEKRRDVIIKLLQPLKPNTTYTVKVAPQFSSKSGASLGSEANVVFTTASLANEQEVNEQSSSQLQVGKEDNITPPSLTEVVNDDEIATPNNLDAELSVDNEKKEDIKDEMNGTEPISDNLTSTNNWKIPAIVGLILVLILIGSILYKNRVKK